MNLQPTHLENDLIKLIPLQNGDFERLYHVASDPLIWEQHPNKFRYKKEVFQQFFNSAVASESAFLIFDAQTSELIGSSRFYDLDSTANTVAIGYTFLARSHWGGKYNRALKHLMINYAFQFVNSVIFHIGADNLRSQKAIQKLGAVKIAEVEMDSPGEANPLNFIFGIKKSDWIKRRS